MFGKIGGFCRRSGGVCLEGVAVVALLVLLAVGLFVWRVSSGPLNLDFLKGQLQQALSWPDRGLSVGVEHVVLEWPDFREPLLLGLKDVRLTRNGRKDVASIDEVGVSLSLAHLFIGRIEPRDIVLKKPSLRLVRTKENDLHFGFQDSVATEEEEAAGNGDADNPGAAFMAALREWVGESAAERSPLSGLESLEIEQASLMVEDRSAGISWFLPRADFLIERDDEKAVAQASFNLPGGKAVAQVHADFSYSLEKEMAGLRVTVLDLDPRILAGKIESLDWLEQQDVLLNASMQAQVGPDFTIAGLRFNAEIRDGVLSLPELYAQPRPFDSLALNVIYDPDRRTALLDQSLSIGEIDIKAEGSVDLSGETIAVPLTVTIQDLPLDKLQAVFPDRLEGTEGHTWLVEKMKAGRFHDVEARLMLDVKREDRTIGVSEAVADFSFDGLSVDYRPPLMPAEEIKGSGRFDLAADTLTIRGETATVGGSLKGSDISLKFSDMSVPGAGLAEISARVTGPLSTALKYVASEPIEFGGGLQAKPEDVGGNVDLKVNVAFPTVKDMKKEDVKVTIDGTLSDVRLPEAVKGLVLTGGPLQIRAADGLFNVKGKAKLDGRDVEMDWQEFFSAEGHPYAGRIVAQIVADKALRDHFGIDLDDYVEGDVPAKVTYTSYGGGRSDIAVEADVTPARLMSEPLGYEKLPGQSGTAVAKALLREGQLQEIVGLNVTAPGLKLENGHISFRQVGEETRMHKGGIDRLMADDTNAAVDFEFQQDGLMMLAVKGPFLDASALLGEQDEKDKDKKYDGPPMRISASADTLRTHPDRTVKKAKIYIEMARDGEITQMEMDAVAGAGDIYLRYKPDAEGRRMFRLEADDAGATLRAFDVYDNVQGGTLTILGKPMNATMRNGGDLTGTARLDNFKVVNAPVLARLLSAMSLPGVLQLLGNDGVAFTRLEGQFDWMSRPKGSLIVLRDGRTSGNALGLTFEGVVDRASGTSDLSGTIVPISDLNQLVSSIPLVGDILAGGADGAIFAATYTIKGPSKEPAVSVNPLAALTPGILRKILFE